MQETLTFVETGFESWVAGMGATPLELSFLAILVALGLLLAACALALRGIARELASARAGIERAAAALRETEDPVLDAASDLGRIRERLETTFPPEIHVGSIVARQLEVRSTGADGQARRPNPNLVVHDFE